MEDATFRQILSDLEFIGTNEHFNNSKEIAQAMSTYLFALAQHNLITTAEFKDIAHKVVKTYMEDDDEEDEQ